MLETLGTRIMIGAAAAVLLAMLAGWLWYRRVKSRSIDARLESASKAVLKDFLIPDGNSGEIHIEYALLTARGILILHIKDVQGHVFGSDAMHDWTVIDGRQRFTFHNPQMSLFDRIAAVGRITPNVPVDGYIAFTNRALFTKGQPSHVIHVDQLLTELEQQHEYKDKVLEAFLPSWDLLEQEAVATPMSHLIRD